MEIKENQYEKIVCECGKEVECYHKFTFPEHPSAKGMVINHCRKCGKGKWDICKGKCIDCFRNPEVEFEKAKANGELDFLTESRDK